MFQSVAAVALPLSAGRKALAATALFLALLIAVALWRRWGMVEAPVLPATVPAPWLILHLICVIPAVPLGAFILLMRKGDGMHRLLGRIWGALMLGTALSSFGLKGLIGGFSPIHLLSILVLVTLPRAVLNARRGNFVAHRRSMMILNISLLAAGLFAFLPGRVLGNWLLG